MRTFLAVDITDEVRERIAVLIERYRGIEGGIKWVESQNIHITLYFLGEADESTLERLEQIITGSLEGIVPFPVTVKGISAFPSLKYPRVIWVGLENEREELSKIFSAIKEGIERENLPVEREKKGYTPHITLGRVKRRPHHRLISEIEKSSHDIFGSFRVENVVLYRSTLTRKGPIYDHLKMFSI